MDGGINMLLKSLSEAIGVSGNENEVRDIIKGELIKQNIPFYTDTMGNLIAHKEKKGKQKLLISAHMDEVGMMITSIEKNGTLKFKSVGGIDPRVLVSKQILIGKNKINGIIGSKAIHLLGPGESKNVLTLKQLYIDIGASSKDEAERLIPIGDMAAYNTVFEDLGNFVKGKAFDDRVGCSILLELLKDEVPFDLYGVFTVQEEVGLRGAGVAAYSINPDLALIIECTSASDVPDSKEHRYSTTLNKGPAISIADMSTIADRRIVETLIAIAEKNRIPYQFRRTLFGGTDAGRIHLSREGIPCGIISVPCRYIHSPVSVLSLDDYNNCLKLINNTIVSHELTNCIGRF